MYLKTFGLGLPLPFFLKEGDALHSYESWTSSRAAPAGRPQAEFTSRGRRARSPKAGAQEPSGRLPAGRAWLRGLTDLPTDAPVPLGRTRVSCTPLLLQPSRACGPPLQHRCQPAAAEQGAQTPTAQRLKHLYNHRLRNAPIKKGTHKIQDQEGCQNKAFLSKARTQPPQPRFQEGPFRQKGPAQENRALILEDPRLTKY